MAKFPKKRKNFQGKPDKNGRNSSPKKRKLTNFEKYLEMENAQVRVSGTDDIELEKRLAKKLKLKNGKTQKIGDNLEDLLGDSDFDEEDNRNLIGDNNSDEEDNQDLEGFNDSEEDSEGVSDSKEDGNDEEVEDQQTDDSDEDEQSEDDENSEDEVQPTDTKKYVPPHLQAGGKSEDEIRLKRQLKGLLNRISEDNIETITSEISNVFLANPRTTVTELITSHVVDSCLNGPRGSEQYAAVFAAFASGLACLVGIDFVAYFVANVATSFEASCKKEDGLAARNVSLLISSLYSFSALSSDLLYDFLQHLCHRFSEIDVSTILHMMKSCGMALRNSDPALMKEFILSVQRRSSELKQSYQGNETEAMSKRVEYMLEAICEVKNNKRSAKDEPAKHTRLKKWLQKMRVQDVQLTSVTWEKLLDPEKKGQWWQQAATENSRELPKLSNAMDTGVAEAEKMLKLAASQRMNTDARRAVFSIIMSSEDYVDAFEKLLRLSLKGSQDREIIRVVVECCLQEKVFNKYYALLASKLCHHHKSHKFTLQFCAWDHFKELSKMELRRSVNLAKLLAFVVGSSGLSLAVLKPIEFGDPMMSAKIVTHFRAFFEALLLNSTEQFIVATFSRVPKTPELSNLADGLGLFLKHLKQRKNNSDLFVKRCDLARKALANKAGITL